MSMQGSGLAGMLRAAVDRGAPTPRIGGSLTIDESVQEYIAFAADLEVGAWVTVTQYVRTWRVTARTPEQGPSFWYTVEDADGNTLNCITRVELTCTTAPPKR